MTNVKIVYNPVALKIQLFYENKEIISSENKVYAFLSSMGLYDCLRPFNRRYIMWKGLLAEMISEFNDDELHIVFEGKENDFEKVEKAFENSQMMVESIGYGNNWHLSFIKNFDIENLMDKFVDVAQEIRDMCETREELYEITRFMEHLPQYAPTDCYQKLHEIVDKHIKKWNDSNEKYKHSKIDLLLMLKTTLDEVLDYVRDLS